VTQEYSTVQCNTVKYSTVLYCTVKTDGHSTFLRDVVTNEYSISVPHEYSTVLLLLYKVKGGTSGVP